MTAMARAILKTLIYADLFDFALTSDELYARLIVGKPLSPQLVTKTLGHLVASRQVDISGPYYFLPGRNQLPLLRQTRLRISTHKQVYATKLAHRLAKFPFIEAIFLTGTVAAVNAETEDDIDLLFIIRPGALWFSRLLITLYLDFFDLRRKPDQTEVRDLVCANLYLDSNHLTVSPHQRNLYTAHEIVLARPIFDRHQYYQRFLFANSWIRQYLANVSLPAKFARLSFPGFPAGLETICYNLQKQYMSAKITREIIGRGAAYFHPIDTAHLILNRYHQALAQYDLN